MGWAWKALQIRFGEGLRKTLKHSATSSGLIQTVSDMASPLFGKNLIRFTPEDRDGAHRGF